MKDVRQSVRRALPGFVVAVYYVVELFAIGAPTAALAVPLLSVYSAMAIAFGLGVRAACVAGGRRGTDREGSPRCGGDGVRPDAHARVEPTFTDTLHITVTALCCLLAMA